MVEVKPTQFRCLSILAILTLFLVLVPAAVAENLLTNPGFESGNTSGWTDWGCDLTATSNQVHTGSYSALASDRTEPWQGHVQSLLGDMEDGRTYRISGSVRLQNADSSSIGLTVRQTDFSGTDYHPMHWSTGYDDWWVQLSGYFTLNVTGSLSELDVYFEGPAAGVNFYLDDAEVVDTGDWKADANDRIEQIRKRDAQITVVDGLGYPVSDVDLQINQIKHRFAFGSAISQYQMDNTDYLNFFKDHFEWAVMENASKWYSNEQSQGDVNYANADIIYNWCQANGIIMRGHCVYWCVDTYVQDWIKALDTAGLQAAVESRMNSAVNHFKGKFVHWDINNEMLHGSYFQDRLGPSIRSWMFQAAHAIDPNCLLFVNEYNVVSGSETDAYKAQIHGLIDDGAPVHGIGAQCHMWGSSVEPLAVYSRLESLAELGLPIWCSEYDFAAADENVRADGLERFYRTAFSHPAVEGILMWGFWQNSHWRDDCHIVNTNWSLNQAGIRYEALMDEWTTNDANTTDLSGNVNFRGFHGTYEIILTPTYGAPTIRTIQLEPGPDPAQFIFSITCLGDFEPDGDVDFEDFCVLAEAWLSEPGQPHWDPGCDISDPKDNVIDERDLAVFTDYWLAGE